MLDTLLDAVHPRRIFGEGIAFGHLTSGNAVLRSHPKVLLLMSKRREARARALQALYAFELSGDDGGHVVETMLQPAFPEDSSTRRFAERLFFKTLDHQEEADVIIGKHIENWEIGRLAVLDRLVLRMAITELLAFEDIPPKVTINEAIELAKGFSTDQSGVFVNGVLDAALQGLQAEGRLNKSGRGLISSGTMRDRRGAA